MSICYMFEKTYEFFKFLLSYVTIVWRWLRSKVFGLHDAIVDNRELKITILGRFKMELYLCRILSKIR
jgi:hypothetical protein